MQLRELTYQGRPIWPPVWNKSKAAAPEITGEVGVLRFVYAHPEMSTKCYIVIEHGGEKYVGSLTFDRDKSLFRPVVRLLRSNLGRSIKDIGRMDIA